MSQKMPFLAKNKNGIWTLYVKEKPFLILGGELHNSAASSLEFMEKEVWPYLRPIALNTVILPIAWENIEEKEGQFDFSLLKGLIDQVRREKKHLVLLWFGLWKNGESFYAPFWVKEDTKKYFRACYPGGLPSNTISLFCEEAIEADQNAFVKLMEFIREYDSEEQTIIMVQVENEIGFLGSEMDFSEAGEKNYAGTVPASMRELAEFDGSEDANWQEVFGEDAPEYFMAYYYACAMEKITSAGKAVYPLPMYANAWLKQHPERPGVHPTGGPVYDMIPVWKMAAPSLDLLAPDIYVPYLKTVCEQYQICDNALFIPEARRDPTTASSAFYALGGAQSLGYSPFAIEDFLREEFSMPDEKQLEELNIDMSGFFCGATGPYVQKGYEILNGMLPLLLQYRGTDRLFGFIRSNSNERGQIFSMTDYDLEIDYTSGKAGSAGLILTTEKGFYIAGCNVKCRMLPKKGSRKAVTLVRLEEGCFQDGVWKRGRILNGDESYHTGLGDMPEVKYIQVSVS